MFRTRRKFITLLLAIVVALVPVRAIQAGTCMDADAFGSVSVSVTATIMLMEHKADNHFKSSPCDAHGFATPATGSDESCDQAGCDQCGSCAVTLSFMPAEANDHLFYAIPIERSFPSYNALLSHQIIPPFRPPRG